MALCVQSSYVSVGNQPGTCTTSWLTTNYANTTNQPNYFIFSAGQIQNINLSQWPTSVWTPNCPAGITGGTQTACPLYTQGFMIEADDLGATPSYGHGDGHLFQQSPNAFSSTGAFNTNMVASWAFGLQGEDTSSNSVVAGGVLPFAASGAFGSGSVMDINDNNSGSTALELTVNTATTASTWQNTNNCGVPGLTGTSTVGCTINNGRFKMTVNTTSYPLSGYPVDFVGFMINSNELLILSQESHTVGTGGKCTSNAGAQLTANGPCMLLSGRMFKQQQTTYPTNSMNSTAFVAYMNSGDTAEVLQLSCDSGANCTINAHNEYNNSSPNTGPVGSATVAANGRTTLGSAPVVFYLYDTGTGSSAPGYAPAGGLMISTSNPELGYLKPQATSMPTSLAGSYFMGTLVDLTTANNSDNDSGSFSTGSNNIATSGNEDSAGQGSIDWGSPFSGFSLTLPTLDAFGVFQGQSGGQIVTVCYLIDPPNTGAPYSNGYGVTGATYACLDSSSDAPNIRLIRGVQ
jgi:hypothetical protein